MDEYEKKYNEAVNDDDIYLRFNLCIDLLNTENFSGDFLMKKRKEISDRALNSARLYIDKLIDSENFIEAEKFCSDANIKLTNVNALKSHEQYKIEMDNFFESFYYRIIDRKYIFNAKNKIEEIEKKSESKIYEILTIFVTIISIIFAFVNGGQVKILYFKIPAFVILAITIVFSWWVIKTINSNK